MMNPVNFTNIKWYAKEDDLIGGWCIMTDDVSPSEAANREVYGGPLEIGSFLTEKVAKHIVFLHNMHLYRTNLGS